MVSGQTGQRHYLYQYSYSPKAYQSSAINAVSDNITINRDSGFSGGPNDDQYYTFGMLISPTVASTIGGIPLNLNLTISYTAGTPTINFTALYNKTVQNTFTLPVVVGDTYKREITIANIAGAGSQGGDSIDPGGTVTYNITDITAGTATQTFTFPFTAGYRFVQAFSGLEWWTYSTQPFPVEYNVNVTNFDYSFDGGVTYYQIEGRDLQILFDGRFPKIAYPKSNFNLVVPGALPK